VSLTLTPLTEIWNGTSWRLANAPYPAHYTGSQLTSVTCTSATACIAVGFSMLGNAHRMKRMTAFADRWNGVRWTLTEVPKPARAKFTQLYAVSCTSPVACTAVGSVNAASSLAVRWNGKAWKLQNTPRPRAAVDRYTYLYGVSCMSATSCMAVGDSDSGGAFSHKYNTFRSLSERWNGRRWAIAPTPRPASATEAFLQGVSCVSANSCTAVGWAMLNPSGVTEAFVAESWNGARWTLRPAAPQPASQVPNPIFSAVSCAATSCMAVGATERDGTLPGSGNGVVSELETSTGWGVLSVPIAAYGSELSAVSCSSAGTCTAVGDTGLQLPIKPVVERWNGASWTSQPTPVP
jgi:hypothetical protein